MRHHLLLLTLVACSSSDPGIHIAGGTTSGDPPLCFVNADCPADLGDACHTVHCDPTGKDTAPGSPVLGCYLLSVCQPCDVAADCPAVACQTKACGGGACITAYEDIGAPCGDGGACDSQGQCGAP